LSPELEPRAIEHGARKAESAGGAQLGELGELRPTRVRQAEEFRGFVESLPGRVVAARPQDLVRTDGAHLDEERMSAGDQQRQVWEGRGLTFEQRRQQVALQMMNAEGGHIPGIGETARQARSGEQRSDEARPCGIGDPADITRGAARVLQRALNQRQQAPDVIARCEFRHHATVRAMQLHLAVELVRQQAGARIQHRGSALVTGGFEGEYAQGSTSSPG
jgi:hypothetical protein